MAQRTKRLNILTEDEVREIFGRPVFTENERKHFFSLGERDKLSFDSLRHPSSKALFLMQAAYFKASHQFFNFEWSEVQTDLDYLQKHYSINITADQGLPSKNTWHQQRRWILENYRYRSFSQGGHQLALDKARELVRIHAQPRFVMTELLRIFEEERICVPGHSTLQKVISSALADEDKRLSSIIDSEVTGTVQASLTDLLKKEGGFYKLTALKKRAKDFTLTQIKREIEKHATLKPVYQFTRDFLPMLGLSKENIRYYASLAEYYPVNTLRKMPSERTRLYLLCFVHHCYEQVSDNLIVSFIHQVTSVTQEAQKSGKQKLNDYHVEHRRQLNKAGKLVRLFLDDSIAGDAPFSTIRDRAFKIIDQSQIKLVADYLTGNKLSSQHYEWRSIQESSRKIALNIRPLFMALEFDSTLKNDSLVEAVGLLRNSFSSSNPMSQLTLKRLKSSVKPSLRKFIVAAGQLEFRVYQRLKIALEAGDIYFSGSTRYKSFDEDLITKEELIQKASTIEALDYPMLNTSIDQRLVDLKKRLNKRYREVNQNIRNGRNPHLRFTNRSGELGWRLPYKKQEDAANNVFYEQLPQVGIINVLRYVQEQTGFLDKFVHIQPRSVKGHRDDANILASTLAYGQRIGLANMAEISDIRFHRLRTTAKNYFRLENTRKANAAIVNRTSALPIFEFYNLKAGALHASADGQKLEAQRATFRARYSKKYFGLGKGLVNYSMVVNHVPANARLIGANEHESHYAFDIVFNNTSEVDPDTISVDMAGTNQVNFVLLETFGRSWAPRYTQINRKATRLVGFSGSGKHRRDDDVIQPSRTVSESLILSEANNIQRIFASMALKTNTQSTIVRKLSSHARRNRTKKALWELDDIYMSLYVLNYIDSLTLRSNVQRALNRGEAYHQLQRTIGQPGGGKFRGTTEHEIAIESDCSRLIANAIIYYNADMLSRLLRRLEAEGKTEEAETVKRLSPVAWRHINLFGRHEFNSDETLPDLDAIVRTVEI
jgi:TnpA family transposase